MNDRVEERLLGRGVAAVTIVEGAAVFGSRPALVQPGKFPCHIRQLGLLHVIGLAGKIDRPADGEAPCRLGRSELALDIGKEGRSIVFDHVTMDRAAIFPSVESVKDIAGRDPMPL